MKDLYLKKRTLGGRIRHVRRGSWRPLFLYALVAVVFIVAAIGLAPHIFQWPVSVTLNGTRVQVPYGTELRRAAANNMERSQIQGSLFAVDGSIIDEYGGGSPSFLVRDREISPDTSIRRSLSITVQRGEDRTEPTAEELLDIEPELVSEGAGPLRQVIDSGQVGSTLRTYGEISEVENLEKIDSSRPVKVQRSSMDAEGSRLAALTFDDGPHPEFTPALLEVLAEEGVKATFFVLGSQVTRHPEIARQIVEDGHQIANHSYSHRDYRTLNYEEKRTDLLRAQDAIENATGVRPNWVRPPYGKMNATSYSLFGNEEMLVAHWSVDPADWRRPGVGVIRERVANTIHPGAVILLHDAGGDRAQTVQATREIIRNLHEEDYQFVTVEQLFEQINR
ncbi:MAG: polysaccharide deacetylase family protein [Coriobacteriia bacterium]|nr:polysaccharide deacetylase family protein [Coriobacteriia bacterium]MCL2871244.1 polysaccharide deacetylase family protein [Coriobacteriia bacterium]